MKLASLRCGAAIVLSLVANALFPRFLGAQIIDPVVIDRNFSSIAAAQDLTSIDEFLNHYEQEFIPQQFSTEDGKASKLAGMLYRAAKFLLFEDIQDEFISLTEHEVFGHGARLREFGYDAATYELHLAPPYGTGDGFTSWDFFMSHDQTTAVNIAGIEAQEILGDENRLRALERGAINYRETNLYFAGRLALTLYALQTKTSDLTAFNGNDIAAYVNQLSGINPHVSLNAIQSQSLLNLLDPMTLDWFYSLYLYLYRGQIESNIPMFSIGAWRYVPGFRFALTPFGYEYYLESLFADSGKVFNVVASLGSADKGLSYSLGMQAHKPLSAGRFAFDWKLEVWRQPELDLSGHEIIFPIPSTSNQWSFGGLISATAFYNFAQSLSLMAEAGYKSRGFVEGEILDSGPILRAGIALSE
ncbi:MAG: hypothetical protein ACHQNE_03670 [Candidatus Kapaibacterium sp.]